MAKLLEFTSKGMYCEAGDFYIDPHRAVNKALITHAHSDHAIRGHKSYLAQRYSVPILKARLGQRINIQSVEYGEIININGVKVTFVPSGHVVGAAQIRIEYKGEVWVVTGDYKLENDGISGKFEPIKCNVLVTESTFGMPIFKWKDQNMIYKEISDWWSNNSNHGHPSILFCYSLGKAQRLLSNLERHSDIYVSDAILQMNKAIEENGIKLPRVELYSDEIDPHEFNHSLILTSRGSSKKIIPRLNNPVAADVSGWVAIQPWSGGFVMSDHADWNGLNYTVRESNPEKVYVMHGYTNHYVAWLRKKGFDAEEVVYK
jgi:putative mRNA 3-end processing factor